MINRKFTYLIIDDERPARLMIKWLADHHADIIEMVGEADNGIEAIELIDSQKPDLIFLDIHIPDMDGFEMLTCIKHQPLVVFTTAFEQYAIKAFEQNTLDYLVKPIAEDRFIKCIEKLKHQAGKNNPVDFLKLKQMFDLMQPKKEITALPIKLKDKIILVRLSEIVYLESELGYVTLHTENGNNYLSDLSLTELEEKLPDNFIRVQKSIILNKEKIGEISKHFNNRLIITMKNGTKSRITTGTTYISKIREELDL